MLATLENQVFAGAIIDVDGKRFLGCKFHHCTLRYAGGECEWDDNTTFRVDCSWELIGHALRIVDILSRAGAIIPGSPRMRSPR
jgi:hypothetical protein